MKFFTHILILFALINTNSVYAAWWGSGSKANASEVDSSDEKPAKKSNWFNFGFSKKKKEDLTLKEKRSSKSKGPSIWEEEQKLSSKNKNKKSATAKAKHADLFDDTISPSSKKKKKNAVIEDKKSSIKKDKKVRDKKASKDRTGSKKTSKKQAKVESFEEDDNPFADMDVEGLSEAKDLKPSTKKDKRVKDKRAAKDKLGSKKSSKKQAKAEAWEEGDNPFAGMGVEGLSETADLKPSTKKDKKVRDKKASKDKAGSKKTSKKQAKVESFEEDDNPFGGMDVEGLNQFDEEEVISSKKSKTKDIQSSKKLTNLKHAKVKKNFKVEEEILDEEDDGENSSKKDENPDEELEENNLSDIDVEGLNDEEMDSPEPQFSPQPSYAQKDEDELEDNFSSNEDNKMQEDEEDYSSKASFNKKRSSIKFEEDLNDEDVAYKETPLKEQAISPIKSKKMQSPLKKSSSKTKNIRQKIKNIEHMNNNGDSDDINTAEPQVGLPREIVIDVKTGKIKVTMDDNA